MKYLAILNGDELSSTTMVFGDGAKMKDDCLKLLNWAVKNKNKPTNLTKISEATNIPRMNIYWIIRDAGIRRQKSTLAKVSRINGFNYEIDGNWRTKNKFKDLKPIIKVKSKV